MAKDDSKVMRQPSAKFQYLAAFVANMLPLGYGVTCGWASPSIELLISDKTPLPSGKITMEEASWIASLICVGGLIGNLLSAFMAIRFGRKIPLIFLSIPSIIGWLLVLYAQNVYYLYASRWLNGFVGGSLFVIVPAFLSEIASDRIRGLLGSTLVLTCNVGILVAFTFGTFLDFYATPKFVILLTAVCGILLFFFHESPSFLVKQNKISEAKESIKFYQNLGESKKDYEFIQSEVNRLRSILCSDKLEKSDDSLKWSDVTTNPGRKALIIGIVLSALNQFCGCFAMLNYTASIFKEAGSTMSPNMSAIFVAVIQLLGSYIATNLVERAGRKILFAVSSIGIALGLIVLGMYMMLKSWEFEVESFNWVPIASFSFVIFIANFAVLSLPFLVISEIMPDKLKEFGTSFCMALLSCFAFAVIKYLPLLTEMLGFHGTMYLFAGVCLCSTVFIITSMPETKAKSYDEIIRLLS